MISPSPSSREPEHSDSRDFVSRVRVDLKVASSELRGSPRLALRRSTADPYELFNRPIGV